jgi:hypothetical protein
MRKNVFGTFHNYSNNHQIVLAIPGEGWYHVKVRCHLYIDSDESEHLKQRKTKNQEGIGGMPDKMEDPARGVVAPLQILLRHSDPGASAPSRRPNPENFSRRRANS